MTNDSPGTTDFHDDFSGPPGFWYVARSNESQRLLDLLAAKPGQPVFVHGRRGVGKSSLLVSHLPRRLAEIGDPRAITFGHLQTNGSVSISVEADGKSFEEALSEPRIICVDNLRSLLQSNQERQLAFLDWLRARMQSDDCKASVLFSLDDEDIGDLMATSALCPEFSAEMFQVRRINPVNAIRRIVEAVVGSSDWLEDGLLERIASDATDLLPDKELAVSPVLAAIAAAQLIAMRGQSRDNTVSVEQYVERERLIGLLEGYVRGELTRLSEAEVATYDDLVRILDELIASDPSGGLDNIEALSARLDMSEQEATSIIDQLVSETGMLRPTAAGKYLLEPAQLHTALRALTRRRRNQLSTLENEITEYTESGLSHGTGLPRDILKQVLLWQHDLKLDQRDTQFVVDWILRTGSSSIEDAAYWLRRCEDHDLRLDIVSGAAFDQDRDARLKATELLRTYDVPEASQILLKLTLHDADAEVREKAGFFLALDPDEGIRKELHAVAALEGSAYRVQAVEALRYFESEATVDLLLDVAQDRGDIETATAAISVLASFPDEKAVQGITDIGMVEQDSSRRESIDAALGNVTNPTHIGRILKAVSEWRAPTAIQTHTEETSVFRIVLRIVLGIGAIFFNLFVPGTLLLLSQRVKIGALMMTLSVANIALLFTSNVDSAAFDFALVGHLLLLLISLIGSAVSLLNAKGQFRWPPWSQQTIVRAEVFITIGLVLVGWGAAFLTGNSIIPPPHGFFHLLTGRWQRAALIFSLQMLSIALWFVGRYQAEIMYPPGEAFLGLPLDTVNAIVSNLFLNAWYLLFVGTMVWDILGISIQRIIFPRLIYRKRRREKLLRRLLSRDAYANYLIGVTADADSKEAELASRLMIKHGDVLPPGVLLTHGETENRRLRRVLEKALARAESSESVSILAGSLESDLSNTQQLAVRALTTRPTTQSLQPLKERSEDLTPYQRRRLQRGRLVHVTRRLASPSGTVAVVLFFIFSFVVWVGSETLLDPYHPLEEHVLLNCDPVSWPPNHSANPYEQSEWAEQRASAALSLAKMISDSDGGYSERRGETIASLRHVYDKACERETPSPNDRLLIRLSALGGLAHLLGQDAYYYTGGAPTLFSNLSVSPVEIIQNGLASSDVGVREQAVLTLQELRSAGAIDAELGHDAIAEFATLLGGVLGDRRLSADVRQFALNELKITGGNESVHLLEQFTLDSGSLFRGGYESSSSKVDRPRAGLGLSGQLSIDESLALESIAAIGEICAPDSLSALDNVVADKGTNPRLKQAATNALDGQCRNIQAAAQSTDDSSGSEISTLQKLFDAEDFEIVVSTADLLLETNNAPELRALAGRANFNLAVAEANPARKMDFYRSANLLLSEYIGLDTIGEEIEPAAVLDLAESRLAIGRGHMDLGWSTIEGREEMDRQFAFATAYFESIYDENVVHAEYGGNLSALFRSLDQSNAIPQGEYDRVTSSALSFHAAAVIDGKTEDDVGDYVEARELLERAIAANPSGFWSRYLMALTYWGTGDYETALALSRLSLVGDDVVTPNPTYELPYRLIYQMRNDLENPVEEFETLRDAVGDLSPWPNYFLAMLYQDHSRQFDKAYSASLEYARLLGKEDEPWMNLLLLEAAISAGRVDDSSAERARAMVANQLNSFRETEAPAVLLLIIANLTTNDGTAVTDSGGLTQDDLVKRLLSVYEAMENGASTNWNGRGLRYFVENCSAEEQCTLDNETSQSLASIIAILETEKTPASIKDLRQNTSVLRQVPSFAATKKSATPKQPKLQ